MAILASVGSLLLVLAIGAAGMRWLALKVHGRRDLDSEFEAMVGDDRCVECAGSGAKRSGGELRPCPVCQGTGVMRAPF